MSTMGIENRATTATDAGFEEQAGAVLRRLEAAMRALIEATPGVTRRPTDLQKTLGIHSKLAWQVQRIAHAEDPFAEARHIPGPVAVQRLLKAAGRRGTPPEVVAEVQDAMSALEELINHHANSRSEFESMLSGLAESGSQKTDLNQRRAVFQGQSHLLGVQADAHMACYVFKPSEHDGSMLDAVGIRGLIGLQRFRRDTGWIISTTRATNEDGTAREYDGPEPLDPENDPEGVGLLPDFCSTPLPMLRRILTADGTTNIEVQPNGLGARSAVTCLVGHVFRNAFGRYADEHSQHHNAQARVRTPCKVLVHDTLMHRDLLTEAPPNVLVYSDHRDVDPIPYGRERDVLAVRESVTFLGHGLSVLETSDVPRYEPLAQYVFDRLGWDADEFAVFRCRVEYPVMPSSVVVQFDAERKPG